MVISRIRWAFVPLAFVAVLTNEPPPVNLSLFVATMVFVIGYNAALTWHVRLPARLVQPIILISTAGDVLLVGVAMYEFAVDQADLGWGFLMLVGAGAAVLYGWRGLIGFGPLMTLALLVATLAGDQFAARNGIVEFVQKTMEVVGVTMIVAFLAERSERQRTSLERANHDLERLILTDSLTGIANRRFFEARWELELERCKRTPLPLAIVIADIDHFKMVNDEHGHAVGDQVLQFVAVALRSSARSIDLVARIGGEEFAFVLPNTDEGEARAFGERVRRVVASLSFGAQSVACTISVGVASSDSTPLPELQIAADRALYRAKATGRNRVESWRGDLAVDAGGAREGDTRLIAQPSARVAAAVSRSGAEVFDIQG